MAAQLPTTPRAPHALEREQDPQQLSCCFLAQRTHLSHAKCAHAYAMANEHDCVPSLHECTISHTRATHAAQGTASKNNLKLEEN